MMSKKNEGDEKKSIFAFFLLSHFYGIFITDK
jgi:hypothetical protein